MRVELSTAGATSDPMFNIFAESIADRIVLAYFAKLNDERGIWIGGRTYSDDRGGPGCVTICLRPLEAERTEDADV